MLRLTPKRNKPVAVNSVIVDVLLQSPRGNAQSEQYDLTDRGDLLKILSLLEEVLDADIDYKHKLTISRDGFGPSHAKILAAKKELLARNESIVLNPFINTVTDIPQG